MSGNVGWQTAATSLFRLWRLGALDVRTELADVPLHGLKQGLSARGGRSRFAGFPRLILWRTLRGHLRGSGWGSRESRSISNFSRTVNSGGVQAVLLVVAELLYHRVS